jgi:triosephosphate isomerase (TIM)
LRTPLVAGNWKMHKTTSEARVLAREIIDLTAPYATTVQVLVAPAFTALPAVAEAVKGSHVGLSAQDMHWADSGAYTGAVSVAMVGEFASHVVVGHSERRHVFGETDDDVNRKVRSAFGHRLTPILCVGETLTDRENGRTDAVVAEQVSRGIDGLEATAAGSLIVAYEPVWAIGTGLPCEPEEAARVSALIRDRLRYAFGSLPSDAIRILYGGSVKPDNFGPYLARADIDGALVGGASLVAESFADLVRIAADPQ